MQVGGGAAALAMKALNETELSSAGRGTQATAPAAAVQWDSEQIKRGVRHPCPDM